MIFQAETSLTLPLCNHRDLSLQPYFGHQRALNTVLVSEGYIFAALGDEEHPWSGWRLRLACRCGELSADRTADDVGNSDIVDADGHCAFRWVSRFVLELGKELLGCLGRKRRSDETWTIRFGPAESAKQ
jgi:hypothetical protein